MKRLLDSNVCIHLLRGRTPAIRDRYKALRLAEGPFATSILVYVELQFEALRSRQSGSVGALEVLIEELDVLPFDRRDGTSAAQIRATLANAGTPIGPYDLLIAAQALTRGLTVVTANVREFARVPGLTVENWLA